MKIYQKLTSWKFMRPTGWHNLKTGAGVAGQTTPSRASQEFWIKSQESTVGAAANTIWAHCCSCNWQLATGNVRHLQLVQRYCSAAWLLWAANAARLMRLKIPATGRCQHLCSSAGQMHPAMRSGTCEHFNYICVCMYMWPERCF